MNKTEAAEILANNIRVWLRKNDQDDADMAWLSARARILIAEAISRGTWECVEGSYTNVAAKLRPADRTVVAAYRRGSGLG